MKKMFKDLQTEYEGEKERIRIRVESRPDFGLPAWDVGGLHNIVDVVVEGGRGEASDEEVGAGGGAEQGGEKSLAH